MKKQDSHDDTYNEGIAKRKEVLGASHVERSLQQGSEFGRPLQELVTEYCWGAVWTRDGLDNRTRSMLNIAMLTVMNRMHELGLHVRGAVTNGVTEQEIQEILLQTAIYAGVPAALEATRVAEKVLNDIKAEAA